MTRVELPFPPPLSACFKNARGRGRVATQRYQSWKSEAAATIRCQRLVPVKGEVSVFVRLVAPDKRARDAGNLDKAIMDCLVDNGIIEDDSNRYVRRLTFQWCEEGPPVVVLIQSIEKEAA